jgi:hypothetical protein
MEADPSLSLARRVLHWILAKQLTSFTRRDCFEAMKGRVRRVEALDPVLSILEAHGCVRRRLQESRGRGRPPAPVFDVNPLVARSESAANSASGILSSGGKDEMLIKPSVSSGDWERIA